jgi:hypothetical protein
MPKRLMSTHITHVSPDAYFHYKVVSAIFVIKPHHHPSEIVSDFGGCSLSTISRDRNFVSGSIASFGIP